MAVVNLLTLDEAATQEDKALSSTPQTWGLSFGVTKRRVVVRWPWGLLPGSPLDSSIGCCPLGSYTPFTQPAEAKSTPCSPEHLRHVPQRDGCRTPPIVCSVDRHICGLLLSSTAAGAFTQRLANLCSLCVRLCSDSARAPADTCRVCQGSGRPLVWCCPACHLPGFPLEHPP